ncbi:MAG: NADH-quinone oxidoreductase subunit N [Paludisphaera borealis]|uniref:NADH-quinone oxidoreductase subunit N n=1 Tax=Paludisphaera borealis TaxID=1387353 RepID=UPI0028486BBB|nr:NADH-quinone oxidoreductase subunit N [Paludisphaera borealis]MDR3618207.1 NADH-quinone oxidoreductase subunit N [Paludisphaera borealis]
MPPTVPTIDFRDFWHIAPAVVLAAWGLVVLIADLVLARRMGVDARRRSIGLLSLVGVGLALLAAIGLLAIGIRPADFSNLLGPSLEAYFSRPSSTIFLGTLAANFPTDVFNVLFVILLGLVVWISTSYTFTDNWGEYFALLIWATVGMMLLAASEELVTLFLALETMTICLYLLTAMEKSRRRSTEAGLKYFVYGSVSSALFLYGLSLVYGLTGTTQFDGIRQVLVASGPTDGGLVGNLAGATALLLMLVGFGFKVAAVPFHQWAPDVYEGAPAPVTAWIATGSKIASFVALLKVFLHAVQPWSHPSNELLGPGWLAVVAVISAVTMTYGNFAALAQKNFKRMLAYSSIAHAGYMLVGVAAVSVSTNGPASAGAVLYYLVVYAFANIGAFAVAAWLVRDRNGDQIDDLNGLGRQAPVLALCLVVLMLSLIGIPPFAGFFGKLYIFMEALNQGASGYRLTLMGLVALGLFNSVISAFYYVRVLKAMYLREPSGQRLGPPRSSIAFPVLISAVVVTVFGLTPAPLVDLMKAAAVPMLTAAQPASETAPPPEMVPAPVAAPVPVAAPAAASAAPSPRPGLAG